MVNVFFPRELCIGPFSVVTASLIILSFLTGGIIYWIISLLLLKPRKWDPYVNSPENAQRLKNRFCVLKVSKAVAVFQQDCQEILLWRGLEQDGQVPSTFFLFFRALPPVRSGLFTGGDKSQSFPVPFGLARSAVSTGLGLCSPVP